MKADDEKAAFEEAIAENPYDETTRKVFADWLEEHGDDDEAILQREWTAEKHAAAEAFLDDYASQCDLSRDELLEIAQTYLAQGLGHTLGFDTPDIVWRSEDFWTHFMVVTCQPVPDEQRADVFLRCAC